MNFQLTNRLVVSLTCRSRNNPLRSCVKSVRHSSRCRSLPGGQTRGGRTWDRTPVAPWTDPAAKQPPKCQVANRQIYERDHYRVSIYLSHVVERMDLWGETAVDAEELLVHQGGQRKAIKRLHASVIDTLRILDFACEKMRMIQLLFKFVQKEKKQKTTHILVWR